MKYHSLTKDAPFEELNIPHPEKLETTEDNAQLVQYMISYYQIALNAYYRLHGYEARQRLLTIMVQLMTQIMPQLHPEYITNYPDSLEDICMMVGSLILMSADRDLGRKAG